MLLHAGISVSGHPHEGEGCYGCWDHTGYQHGAGPFTDTRSGRNFCHECAECLIRWELDGYPTPDEFSYPEWISDEAAVVVALASPSLTLVMVTEW